MEYTKKYAGFWKRFLALIIDKIVLGAIHTVIFIPLWMIFGVSLLGMTNFDEFDRSFTKFTSNSVLVQDDVSAASIIMIIMFGIITLIIVFFIQWLYYALMESSSKQATLGKMAVGIKVTDMSGARIGFGKASGRYFGKILSGLILNIGYIIAAFTEKKQALHDILAGCLVVNVNYSEPVYREITPEAAKENNIEINEEEDKE
ncbi:MAG: RDD family protein [Melioribacteraceae bacterium]|nr:RDD family protein [Melioribacteraceae bacterium]